MLMFLMILAASVPVMVLSALLMAGLSRRSMESRPEAQPAAKIPVPKASFFAEDLGAQPALPAASDRAAVEVLLRELERHVRTEQAVAAIFLDGPNARTLHSRPGSSVLN